MITRKIFLETKADTKAVNNMKNQNTIRIITIPESNLKETIITKDETSITLSITSNTIKSAVWRITMKKTMF